MQPFSIDQVWEAPFSGVFRQLEVTATGDGGWIADLRFLDDGELATGINRGSLSEDWRLIKEA